MPDWIAVSAAFFVYISAVALVLPGLARRARVRACAGAGLGLLLAATGANASAFWLRDVLLPPTTLLVGYWTSGLLWVAPMEGVERFLVRSDRALGIPALAGRLPQPLVELLEFAYAAVYPLIPLALLLHLTLTPSPDADRFWTVVLATDFICFGLLPWIQTRPPRALGVRHPWRSAFRALNVKLLGSTSIGVNTVPSGHAAEAVAAALLVSGAPWPAIAGMWLAAAAISAGAVLGRYHYAIDAVGGWAVALAVWMVVTAM